VTTSSASQARTPLFSTNEAQLRHRLFHSLQFRRERSLEESIPRGRKGEFKRSKQPPESDLSKCTFGWATRVSDGGHGGSQKKSPLSNSDRDKLFRLPTRIQKRLMESRNLRISSATFNKTGCFRWIISYRPLPVLIGE
jgi:hypothetical protein